MKINSAKIAAALSIAHILFMLSATIEAALSGVPFKVIWFVFRQSQSLSTTVICLLLAFGLWRQYRWAWWLGITAGLVQFGRIVWFWVIAPSVAVENLLLHAMVAIFLINLALPSTRRLCVRQLRA